MILIFSSNFSCFISGGIVLIFDSAFALHPYFRWQVQVVVFYSVILTITIHYIFIEIIFQVAVIIIDIISACFVIRVILEITEPTGIVINAINYLKKFVAVAVIVIAELIN